MGSIFQCKKKVLSWEGPEFQSDTHLGPTHGSLQSHLGWAGLGVCVLRGNVSWGCHTWTHTTPPLSLVRQCTAWGFLFTHMLWLAFVSLHLVRKSCGEGLSILAGAGPCSGDFVDRVASSGKIPQVPAVGRSCRAPLPQASVTSEWTSEGLQWGPRSLAPRLITPATRLAPAGCGVDL